MTKTPRPRASQQAPTARVTLQPPPPSPLLMQIWIDADACPAVIKDIVFRAAERLEISTTLVANRMLRTPPSRFIRAVQVPAGFDVADRHIVDQVEPGDLVICSDVPLADRLVKKGVVALDPRGREFDERNMGERLAVRNLFTDLREQGQVGGGQAPYGEREKQAFANALDRILTRLARAYPQ